MSQNILYFLFFLIVGCNEQTVGNKAASSINNNDSINISYDQNNSITGCYLYVNNRDTLLANLVQIGKEVTGTLAFDNYQIDGSSGNVKGVFENEILKLKYSFFSEGIYSVMDVYLKLNSDSSLVRGKGNMETKGDTAYFTNPDAIDYPSETILKKIECGSINN